MKKNRQTYLLVLLVFFTSIVFSQDISSIKDIDVNALSDEEIASYWSRVQKKGYTMEQVEVLGKAQGVSASKLADFKRRVNALVSNKPIAAAVIEEGEKELLGNEPYGLKEGELFEENSPEPLLFGYDFFNNAKISFAPAVNIAVPENYQIGPGDEIMIDLWGASEITYNATVNNAGSIQIKGIGFIFINGFTLENASKKIRSKLKSKHAGIAAPSNSYNKINTNITVSKIRTVQVNIIGEVKVPGTYALNSLSTVLNALYVAGGPTKMGTFRAVKLVRANKVVAVLDIYSYLLFGTQEGNLKLQDQDVLLVGPYLNLVSVEGAVKRPGLYELKEGQTLFDLVKYFGGFTPKAYTSLLVIERLNGTRKEVKEVVLKEASSFQMQAGDKLVVQEILDTFENKVVLEGEVFRAGDYELTNNMDLKMLLTKAEGVTPDAFLPRGLLVRTEKGANKENIAFSVEAVLKGEVKILLNARDQVRIFNKKELREERTISISGAVNTPQTIDFIEKLQIEDVIAMSGGLQEGADPEVISVSRRLKDGSFASLSQIFAVSSERNLSLNNGNPFYLAPFDIVNVRYEKGYRAQESVVVKGEVKYEGDYILESKNERISDLIKRAGGLTDFADIKGAALIRKIKEKKTKEILKNIANSEGDNLDVEALQEMEETATEFKIGIDLVSILSNKGSEIDMFLREGDVLMIPAKSQTVEVLGIVLRPSLVLFKEGQSLRTYIEKSGGFGETAKKSKIYVSYANGDIKTVRNFFFYKRYPKLAPGATIFVPAKPEKAKMSTAEILGITSSIATLGILIQTMLR
ncbi:putative capsule polysaccharide export protein [Polaribacter irgensii 23-P]|uniref:Putative capsule polysaccharide export protein n=1 Tax=Polaribacter irgensii 23-P TaxID=313594 RepID=A4BYL4_9FLAO|nr:SLBB domain-containing protein [Polaribacter irgensii]EAR12257.1 putative capsule polysaccharide export protein [Polaribacter irgensii 23-P]